MKNLWSLFVLVFALVLLCAITAFAGDAAVTVNGQPFGEVLSVFLKDTVFPILGALLLGFASWAAKGIGSKYKIKTLTEENNFAIQLAAQGVAFAEEKAAAYAKNAAPLAKSEKLNSAMAYVMQMAPKVTEAQAQSLVTSALAMLPGAGATGNNAVGVGSIPPLQTLP